MKKSCFLALSALFFSSIIMQAENISLPKPDLNRETATVTEALASRHSVREFSKTDLTLQDLSDLCWAACGINREDGRLTSPTAMNKQEIRLFVFDRKGVYEYIASSNELKLMASGDKRGLVAGGKAFKQDFVKDAPVSLVMVIDFKKFGSDSDHARMMACVDAGNVSENINLFCQAAGMVTVPRASMASEGIKALLGLDDSQLPIMNNPVGYPKK